MCYGNGIFLYDEANEYNWSNNRDRLEQLQKGSTQTDNILLHSNVAHLL